MGQSTTDDSWIPTRLLIPWSSRVGFSNSVCGLPGDKGCWRHEQCRHLDLEVARDLMERSISSSRRRRPTQSCWVAFVRSAGGGTVEQVVLSSRAAVDHCRRRPNAHVVVFEFDLAQVGIRPHSYECRAWWGGRHSEILDWWNPDGPLPSLFACFGKELFVPRDLSAVRVGAQASIADLIQGFLDQGCSWFRLHSRGSHFGVSWCHLEVALLQRSVEETTERFRLDDYLVTFSLIDPSTLELEHLREPHILNLDPDGEFQELRRSMSGAMPLRATPDSTKRQAESVCYADCLTTRSREQLLAAEIDNSFLQISVPEITVYLLDWLLARILAAGDRHGEAATLLKQLVERDDDLEPAMAALLESEVRLDPDPRLFGPTALANLDKRFHPQLGAFPDKVPFRTVLETADLHRGGEPLLETARFLSREFTADGYRDLPMFSDLGWCTDRHLVETDWSELKGTDLYLDGKTRPMALEVLARVVRSIAREHTSLSVEQAEERAHRLARRSVFPLAHILTHWPSQKGACTYFVFPIWESLIGDEYRPSIFAHVFSAHRPSDEDPNTNPRSRVQRVEGELIGKPPDSQAALKEATQEEARFLIAQLLPFGRLIAQSTYDDQLRRSQVESRLASAAYSIGHPMKRRVDSVHAALNSLLDLKPNDDARALIHDAGRSALRVSRLGHVLDVLSDALQSGDTEQVFWKKQEWRNYEPLAFAGLIESLDGSCLAPGVRPVRIPQVVSIETARIGCWLHDREGRPYRPADLFYEELVYELFLNAAKHGAGDDDGVPVEVRCREPKLHEGPGRAVTVVNGIEPRGAMSDSPWAIWNEEGDAPVGGLYFLAALLHRAGLGRLWTRRERRSGENLFVVALELNGLESMA